MGGGAGNSCGGGDPGGSSKDSGKAVVESMSPSKGNQKVQKAVGDSAAVPVSRCPFLHGTPAPAPYPGYVHGTHPEICETGCTANPSVLHDETPDEYLIREAIEYQNLYHGERKSAPGVKEARCKEILASINKTGTYEHTYDEMNYGAQLAWRNAPKCANRKFWDSLEVIDSRHCKTNAEMFESCCKQMNLANSKLGTVVNMNLFRPKHPREEDGPRVWNVQLSRFAGWINPDSTVTGDPVSVNFTQMLERKFGWSPKEGKGMFTILPLVLQVNPDEPPELFEWDPSLVLTVPIRHPQYPWLSRMGLRWYAIPIVSCCEVEIGGLRYTACPFNGWYADTEVLRDLTDEKRYNLLPVVAKELGRDITQNGDLWRDHALVVLNEAIVRSYSAANVSMVDHHTLIRQFWEWYHIEKDPKEGRGYCPGNWKWIIPPVAAHTSRCYLELNKMIEYTLRPAILPGKNLEAFNKKWAHMDKHEVFHTITNARLMLLMGRLVRKAHIGRLNIAICYSTVSGNTKQFALRACKILKIAFTCTLFSSEAIDDNEEAMKNCQLFIYLTCTHGSGNPPGSAKKFVALVSKHPEWLRGKLFSVFGVGSSAYPRFCGAADLAQSLLLEAECRPLCSIAKGDVVSMIEKTFTSWIKSIGVALGRKGIKGSKKLLVAVEEEAKNAGNVSFEVVGINAFEPPQQDSLEARVEDIYMALPDGTGPAQTSVVRLDMSQCGHNIYFPGDHIAIKPKNGILTPALTEWLEHFGFDMTRYDSKAEMLESSNDRPKFFHGYISMKSSSGTSADLPMPEILSYEDVFTSYIDLPAEPSEYAMKVITSYAGVEDAEMVKYAVLHYEQWRAKVHPRWMDLFTIFPSLKGRIPHDSFFSVASYIKPRFYSIASAPQWVENGRIEVCVGKLVIKTPAGQTRYGFSSSYITALGVGDTVRYSLHAAASYRLPFDPMEPMVWVAAGTGIAPFRSFWQERMRRLKDGQALGPAILVYGCRGMAKDALFTEALKEALEAGALTKVIYALSQDPDIMHKTYVQDAILKNADSISPILEHPRGHVYICGSSNMSASVGSAFAKVGGVTKVHNMAEEGRYHEEVFGVESRCSAQAVKYGSINALKLHVVAMSELIRGGDMEELSRALRVVTGEITIDDPKDPFYGAQGVDLAANWTVNRRTLLHVAVASGSLRALRALIHAEGVNINAMDQYGTTPLGLALAKGKTECAEVLKAVGAKPICSFYQNFYPLHAAAAAGDDGAIRELLDKGANPNHVDFFGNTAVTVAAGHCHPQVVDVMASAKANFNVENKWGNSALTVAYLHTDAKTIESVKRGGGSLVPENAQGYRPVMGDWDPTSDEAAKEIGLTPEQIDAVCASLSWIANPANPESASSKLEEYGLLLFDNLFEIAPSLHKIFPFKDVEGKVDRKKLAGHATMVIVALYGVIEGLKDIGKTVPDLQALIRRHVKYGVMVEHYEVLGDVLNASLNQFLGDRMTDDDKKAWATVTGIVAAVAKGEYEAMEKEAAAAAGAGGE